MIARIGYLVVDAVNPDRLAEFWCTLLGVGVETSVDEGRFVVLTAAKGGLPIVLQRVPESKANKNRLHLDLIVDDLAAATSEVEALGGRWLEKGNTHEVDGYQWRVMADPEGNEFDLQMQPINYP